MINKNSMTYWYPKIKDLDIPQPQTEMVELKADYWDIMGIVDRLRWGWQKHDIDWDNLGWVKVMEPQMDEIQAACMKVGLPAFMRTAYTSGKHDWTDTCFIQDIESLSKHILALIEDSAMKELDVGALVFREYIEMDSKFTAFLGAMPVNPERRYFIKDGEVQCHHAYWIPEAIAQGFHRRPLPENWLELLVEMNQETEEEVELLSSYALQIAEIIEGYWSVDFCKAKDGRWILIDMALGEASWHGQQPPCKYGSL